MSSFWRQSFLHVGAPIIVSVVCGMYVLVETQKLKISQKDRQFSTSIDDLPSYMQVIRKAEEDRLPLEEEFEETVGKMDLKDYDMIPIERPKEWREDEA